MLKSAISRRFFGIYKEAAGDLRPADPDGNDFARFNFPYKRRLDAGQGTGFGGYTVKSVPSFTNHQRTESPGIAAGFDAILKQKDHAESALQMPQNMSEGIGLFLMGGFSEHVYDDFRVTC